MVSRGGRAERPAQYYGYTSIGSSIARSFNEVLATNSSCQQSRFHPLRKYVWVSRREGEGRWYSQIDRVWDLRLLIRKHELCSRMQSYMCELREIIGVIVNRRGWVRDAGWMV